MSKIQEEQRLLPDEETCPCSLKAIMKQFIKDSDGSHAALMKEFGFEGAMPSIFRHASAQVSVYSDLKRGARELAWFPKGLRIIGNLEEFFLSWKIKRGVETIMNGDLLIGRLIHEVLAAPSQMESWAVTWRNSQEIREEKQTSGFFKAVSLPDAISLTAMLARALFRKQEIPFASTDPKNLIFVRTCTPIGKSMRLAVAIVPEWAVYYRAFVLHDASEQLVNSDIVPVTLAE